MSGLQLCECSHGAYEHMFGEPHECFGYSCDCKHFRAESAQCVPSSEGATDA